MTITKCEKRNAISLTTFNIQHSSLTLRMALHGWLLDWWLLLFRFLSVFHFYAFLLWYLTCASQSDARCTMYILWNCIYYDVVHSLFLSPLLVLILVINCISFNFVQRESNIYCLLLFRVFILKFLYRLCPFYDPKRIPMAKWIVDCGLWMPHVCCSLCDAMR